MGRTVSIAKSIALLGFGLLLTGCSGGDIGTVTGTVHMDGKPLEGALVTFYPQVSDTAAANKGGASMGRTDAEGNYELIYNRDIKGAEVGEHLVYIETLEEGGGGDYGAGRKEEVPKRYNAETELKVTVKAGSNVFNFKNLTSEGEKVQARDANGNY